MTTPAVYFDFDGVFNFLGTVSSYRRTSGHLGYIRQATIPCGGMEFPVQWSAQLVRELNGVKRRVGFDWFWLSTWQSCAVSEVDPVLGIRSDGHICWDADEDLAALRDQREIDAMRPVRKYEALLADLSQHPRPFVWVDDDATGELREADFVGSLDIPRLILTPTAEFGILRSDLDELIDFVTKTQG